MNPLTVVRGTIVETQRFINVPLRMWERYPARERREVWLREADGQERKWVIHTRVLPARRGHRVVLLLEGDWVVGLFNATTGADVNYPRTDPPFLLRGFDLLLGLALAVGVPAWLGDAGLALLPPTVVLYVIVAACGRVLSRWRLRRQVDKTLAEVRMANELHLAHRCNR
jgi:hypothetical protein